MTFNHGVRSSTLRWVTNREGAAFAAPSLLVTHPCEHRSPEGRTEGNESRGADYCCDEATKIDNSFIFSKNRLYAIAI